MTRKQLVGALLGLAVVGSAVVGFSVDRRGGTESVDFEKTPHPTQPVYDAAVAAPSRARVREFRIPITHGTITIAEGKTYEGWMFGGTVPGPVIRVRQGDLVKVTVVNESPMPHSIDFHAARIPMDQAFTVILPGKSHSFEFTANDPGVFMVHCGTAPISAHIMNGMYFPMIVDPAGGWGTHADKEFVVVQSEFYARPDTTGAPMQMDLQAMSERRPSYVVFNGRAGQYKRDPLRVDVGDRVRFFVMNAGPNFQSDFHIVGALFDRVIPGGDPSQAIRGVQTWGVPAGSGAVFETRFDRDGSGEGTYAFVTHAFADAEKGAAGLIKVGAPTPLAAGMGH